jgi:hypothetical protein
MKNFAILLSMILLLCGGCKYFKKQTPKSVDIITADTNETENSYDSAAYYSSTVTETAAPSVSQSTQSNAVTGKYYMIVGCFKVDANADRYAEKIRSMGYNVELLAGMNDFEMVAARSYNSYRESVNEIDKFRTEVTPNAWVYLQR